MGIGVESEVGGFLSKESGDRPRLLEQEAERLEAVLVDVPQDEDAGEAREPGDWVVSVAKKWKQSSR